MEILTKDHLQEAVEAAIRQTQKKNEEIELLTIDEAAAFLKVNRKTAVAFMSALPKRRVGRSLRVVKTELIIYLNKHQE